MNTEKEHQCLSCGYGNASFNALDGKSSPKPGDISLCLKCGHLMGFDEHSNLRELTEEEMLKIAGSKELMEAQEVRKLASEALSIKKAKRSFTSLNIKEKSSLVIEFLSDLQLPDRETIILADFLRFKAIRNLAESNNIPEKEWPTMIDDFNALFKKTALETWSKIKNEEEKRAS